MDGQNEGNGRIYNQRGLTKKGIAIRKTLEGPSCVVSEEEKKNSSSDEARWQTFTPPLRRWRSCLTVDEVLTKARFLSPLLYQIHCIGPVGFGFAHIYSEGPLKSGPYSFNSLIFFLNETKNFIWITHKVTLHITSSSFIYLLF